MRFDLVFGEDADVPHVVQVAVEQLEENLRLGEFQDLGLVDQLAKLSPPGVEHKSGQGALSGILGDVSGL